MGNEITFEAILRVTVDDPTKHGKTFRGVVLERDGGERWVLSYGREDVWQSFDGKRVVVRGEPYTPEFQALTLPHLRLTSLKMARVPTDDMAIAYIEVGEEKTLSGAFSNYTWPPGTKLEGEIARRFVDSAGTSYWLAGGPASAEASAVPDKAPVRVTGRVVEPSPFVARPGGPYLWIRAIER